MAAVTTGSDFGAQENKVCHCSHLDDCFISFWCFPGGSAGKESRCSVGDLGLIPGLGRYAGEGIDYPLQYSWASLVVHTVNNLAAM